MSLVVLTFILDIVLVWFLEILFNISGLSFKVMEVYKGKYLSNILVYEFENITRKAMMCVIQVSFSYLGW